MFRVFIEKCQARTEEDGIDDNLPAPADLNANLHFEGVTLAQLFDYANKSWNQRFAASRGMTLHEEMELYELLDFDADGEADKDELDIDDATEAVLVE
jgi:hypothetical protein